MHLFFQLVLAFSGLRFVQLAFGETFEALLSGLQAAFVAVRGVPAVVRLDNLSAATHELKETRGRALTARFATVVDHYGFTASRIQPGEGHENGVAEKAHHLLKKSLGQELLLRALDDLEAHGGGDGARAAHDPSRPRRGPRASRRGLRARGEHALGAARRPATQGLEAPTCEDLRDAGPDARTEARIPPDPGARSRRLP